MIFQYIFYTYGICFVCVNTMTQIHSQCLHDCVTTNNIFWKWHLKIQFEIIDNDITIIHLIFEILRLRGSKTIGNCEYLFGDFSCPRIHWFIIFCVCVRACFEVVTWFQFNLKRHRSYD